MSGRPLFDQHSEGILEAIKAGASIPDAAREAGVGEPTVKGWLSRGRKDPKSKYGSFAARVDAAFTERKLPAEGDRPADRSELLVLTSRAARAGNVQAMRLLSELLGEGDGDSADELSRFEPKAKR